MKLATGILACALLGGCAVDRTGAPFSYVSPDVLQNDARAVAADATTHLAQQLAPAKTTIILYPGKPSRDTAIAALADELRAFGFGVALSSPGKDAPAVAGVPLRYLVSPLDGGLVVRLQYMQREDARFYARAADGSLVAPAPFSVRESVQ